MTAKQARTVIVSLKSGEEILGVMRDDPTTDLMVLTAARIEGVDGANQPDWHTLPGDIVIPMDNVSYWQESLPANLLDQLVRRA